MDCVPLLVDIDFSDWGANGEQMTAEWAARTINSYLSNMLHQRDARYYQSLSVFLTQRCNLRCIDCSLMVPYVRRPVHFSAERTIQSINNAVSYSGLSFQEITFIGGEPLLYPELPEVMEAALKQEGVRRVSIVTNGTLIPDQETLSLMRHPRFALRISDYGTLSRKKAALIALMEKEKIPYELTNYSVWYELRKPLAAPCGEAEADRKYAECTTLGHTMLYDGYLMNCCAAHMLNVEIGEARDAGIDCVTEDGLRERIRAGTERFQTCGHIGLCHRCPGLVQTNMNHFVAPARQAVGELSLSNSL